MVVLRIEAQANVSIANPTGYAGIPSLVYARDYDGTIPSDIPTMSDLMAYGNAKRFTFSANRPAINIAIRPKINLEALDRSGGNVNVQFRKNPWIDHLSVAVNYNSILLAFDTETTGTSVPTFNFSATARYYISCLNPR